MNVHPLHTDPTDDAVDEAIDVMTDAFVGYPVMRFIFGDPPDGRRRAHRDDVRRLVRFFVLARALSGHPILGARDDEGTGRLLGVATVSPPVSGDPPEELARVRSETWAALGDDALRRYEAFGRAASQFIPDERHHHLHMIGVPPAHQGRGIARSLLDAVHDLADRDTASVGVSLSTETPGNVTLYEHFGYRLLGEAHVGDGLRTWVMFRPA